MRFEGRHPIDAHGEHAADDDGKERSYVPSQWIYRNLTPYRIKAHYDDDGKLRTPCFDSGHRCQEGVAAMLSISALGEVVVPHEDAVHFDTVTMRQLGQLELRPAPSCFLNALPRAIVIYGWLAVGTVVTMWALLFGGGSAVPWRWGIAVVIAIPMVALVVATGREIHLYRRFRRYRNEEGHVSLEGVQRGGGIQSFVDGAPRQLAEFAVLAGALVVTVVGLGVAIHLTTQLNELMPIDYGALVQLDNPFAGLDPIARQSPAFWQMLVGHIAQWVLVSVAAIVPAAMYFQFDRQRLAAVQQQWVRDVFRLDPTVRTVRDIEAKYGSHIEASFGDLEADSSLRLGRGRRSPIIVATILLVVGWFLVISTTQVPMLTVAELADGRRRWQWPGDETFPVSTFFAPHLTLVGYAFLGAYVFTIFHTIRGYQRHDLHPKTYNTVVVRILTAYALGLVVGVVYEGVYAEVVMFFVGFMPQSALVWLREQLNHTTFKTGRLHEPTPLTELEGIDLYDRTRLAEEGINNVEALAHSDIINLMSSTRIPAAQIVDWTDQALLFLKVGGDCIHPLGGGLAAGQRARSRCPAQPVPPPLLRDPHRHGPHAGVPRRTPARRCRPGRRARRDRATRPPERAATEHRALDPGGRRHAAGRGVVRPGAQLAQLRVRHCRRLVPLPGRPRLAAPTRSPATDGAPAPGSPAAARTR